MKLDLGCGTRKQEGFLGVDIRKFDGVDIVTDLAKKWPWDDEQIDEVHCCHFVEHLTGKQRIHFFNELYRVLKKGATARIICPHWSHDRAYGDPTHQWPPITSWTFFYLNKGWRDANAPHVDYKCDFDYTIVGTHDPNDTYVAHRNLETKVVMMSRGINTTVDIVCTLTKK